MENIKLNKLFATLEHHTSQQKNFEIAAKNLTIKITGDIHKIDDQYCFTQGTGKVLIEHQKTGSILTWKGTQKTYLVKFMVGNSVLAEFEIPENAKLQLSDIE